MNYMPTYQIDLVTSSAPNRAAKVGIAPSDDSAVSAKGCESGVRSNNVRDIGPCVCKWGMPMAV